MPDALTNPMATPKIVWGARKIADKIGRTPRAVYHLIETGSPPAKRADVAAQKSPFPAATRPPEAQASNFVNSAALIFAYDGCRAIRTSSERNWVLP
jgi:hypothetical protein